MLFCKFLVLLDERKEATSIHVFHHDVEVSIIVEKAIQLYYIGMIQEHLNFDLLYELVQHVFHLFFSYLLQGYQHSCLFMNGDEYLAETTFSFALSERKIRNVKFMLFSWISWLAIIKCVMSFNMSPIIGVIFCVLLIALKFL